MLTKFRNFTDRVASSLIDSLTYSPVEDIKVLESQVLLYKQRIEQLETRIAALTERNSELEQANETLVIQRFEVRKRLEELGRYFPK